MQRHSFKSVLKGNAYAQNNLGLMIEKGLGVAQDYVKAREWLEKAAQSNAKAQSNLGYMCQKGLGGTQDYARARKLYKKAAALGSIAAQVNLGMMYQNAQGVMRDYTKARKLYEKAAAQGDDPATQMLFERNKSTLISRTSIELLNSRFVISAPGKAESFSSESESISGIALCLNKLSLP